MLFTYIVCSTPWLLNEVIGSFITSKHLGSSVSLLIYASNFYVPSSLCMVMGFENCSVFKRRKRSAIWFEETYRLRRAYSRRESIPWDGITRRDYLMKSVSLKNCRQVHLAIKFGYFGYYHNTINIKNTADALPTPPIIIPIIHIFPTHCTTSASRVSMLCLHSFLHPRIHITWDLTRINESLVLT